MSVLCKLVVDNDGQCASLAPAEFLDPSEGRTEAFEFAEALVALLGKGFNPDWHRLKIPGVPAGAIDMGIHSTTHNGKFHGGPLTTEQVELIKRCTDTFELKVDLTDFKVLVGFPSNDEATGVVGYVGLLITEDSLPEYNRAMAVYGGLPCERYIAHVTVCGWELKGFSVTSEARAAFGLVTADGEKYPDGNSFYTANVFPSLPSPSSEVEGE